MLGQKNKRDIVRTDKVAELCALTGARKESIISSRGKGHYIPKNRNAFLALKESSERSQSR